MSMFRPKTCSPIPPGRESMAPSADSRNALCAQGSHAPLWRTWARAVPDGTLIAGKTQRLIAGQGKVGRAGMIEAVELEVFGHLLMAAVFPKSASLTRNHLNGSSL